MDEPPPVSNRDVFNSRRKVTVRPPYTFYAVALLYHHRERNERLLVVHPLIVTGAHPVTPENIDDIRERARLHYLEEWSAKNGHPNEWDFMGGCVTAHVVWG